MKATLTLAAAAALAAATAFAEGKTHYVAVHVNENDPKVMNMALNNVQNVNKY